jgi:hypothetical protein
MVIEGGEQKQAKVIFNKVVLNKSFHTLKEEVIQVQEAFKIPTAKTREDLLKGIV